MKTPINWKVTAILIAVISISSCKDDEDETPQNPSGNNNQAKTEVSADDILNGSITTNLNPSGVAPLTAELTFNTNKNSEVEITVQGKLPVSHTFQTITSSHTIPVLGLYPDTMNQVILKITDDMSYAYDTVMIQTDSLPAVLPTIEIVQSNPSMMEEGMNLNCFSITNGTNFEAYPLIYDRNGDIRWFLDLSGKYQAAGFVSPWEPIDGGFLLAEVGDQVIEFDMLGREHKVITLPSSYKSHHDVIKLDNGNYVVAVNKSSSQLLWTDTVGATPTMRTTVEDIFIEMGPGGNIIQEWDLKDILDVDRENIVNSLQASGNVDWFHMNAIYYSESDDSFILSGRNQGVVKVNRQGELVWIMSPKKGWEKAGPTGNGHDLDSLLLTAVDGAGNAYDTSIQNGNANDPNFDWPWGQHAPLILPNGNIALFDNGVNRIFSGQNAPNHSRYVEYDVDESNMTIRQVKSYGESRGADAYSFIISDVDYLPNTQNLLFCPGVSNNFQTSRIIELSPSMNVVFEGKLTFRNLNRPSGGGLVFGQLDLTYRAERVKLYRD